MQRVAWSCLWLPALLSLAAPARAQPATARRALDLAQLTELALAHSHQLRASDHALSAALAQLGEARLSPFFQWRAKGGFAWVPDATGTPGYTLDDRNPLQRGFGPGLSGGVEATVPLWTFGKLSAARDAARAGVEAAKLTRLRSVGQLRYDVRRAYFALALSLDAQQMLEEGLPKLEKARKQLEERLGSGDTEVDETERYRMSTTLAEVRARQAEADHLEATALVALRALTGLREITIPECSVAALVFEPKPLEHYQALARKHRPELRLLEAAQGARRAERDGATARFFPDLALALSLDSQYAPGRTTYEYVTPLTLGAAIVARWELDFVGHHFRARRARERLLEVTEQHSHAAEGSDVDIADRRAAVLDSAALVEAWATGHRDARKWFVTAAQSYQLGLIGSKDLIEGVTAYFKARFAHLQAIHDLNLSVAGLEQAVGIELLPPSAWAQRCDEGP